MCGWWGVRGVAGGARRRGWPAALLCWVTLCLLALLQMERQPPKPAARMLLQSDLSHPSLIPAPMPELNEAALRADVERRMPSLPLSYWHAHKNDKGKFFKKKDCAPFPSVYELEFHNTYWQTLHTASGAFHLYGAYLDVRNASLVGPAVRLLAVHYRIKPRAITHCQLWFEERAQPVIVRNLAYKYVWYPKWGNYRDKTLQPYLLACVLPATVRALVPRAVSLVEAPCDTARNLLRVHYDPPATPAARRDVAVCVKGLDFLHEDLSLRLVEWIELLLLLGADTIHFYVLQVHPNISRVLEHYERRGRVSVTRTSLPGGMPNLPTLQHMYLTRKTTPKRQMELIPYNDCLYRHMYRYRWLTLLDIDEVIVPLEDADWGALLRRVLPLSKPTPGNCPRTSLHASNVYFLDEPTHAHRWQESVPRHMHMLQQVWRTRNFTKPGHYVKAFHVTDRVLVLHNHFPLACLGGPCSSYALDTQHARLQHYRSDCVKALTKTCVNLRADTVRDTALWRWRDMLVTRANVTLAELGLLPPQPHR